MRKPGKLWLKILLFCLYCVFAAVWFFLELPCVFRHFFHIICPGCGMTRAWLSVLQLDLVSAFRYHPMFWSVPVLALYILYDGHLFSRSKLNNWVLGVILAGFLVSYVVRFIVFLDGGLFI